VRHVRIAASSVFDVAPSATARRTLSAEVAGFRPAPGCAVRHPSYDGSAMNFLPQRSLREYLGVYKQEHTHLGTKLTHMVGIPMIVASVPTAFVNPPLAGGLFVGGWALQFIGHAVFEKSKPSFFADPYYLLVGPVWVAAEWAELFGLPVPEMFHGDSPASEPAHDAKSANGEAATAAS
jgi:hypothetical protein